jgi:hypothetical protein
MLSLIQLLRNGADIAMVPFACILNERDFYFGGYSTQIVVKKGNCRKAPRINQFRHILPIKGYAISNGGLREGSKV